VNLLIDESLSSRVAHRLKSSGHDAVHVSDLGLLGAPDVDVMAAARTTDRCIVSVDTDFGH
jgi:predicted nuclease of predicted toxin-antitoxin system